MSKAEELAAALIYSYPSRGDREQAAALILRQDEVLKVAKKALEELRGVSALKYEHPYIAKALVKINEVLHGER